MKFPLAFFRLLGSRRLTVLLIVLLAVALAGITFAEAVQNTGEVPHPLYLSWWFTGLLAALWINLLCNFAHRSWWTLRKIPALLVHLALLVILAGGFFTWKLAIRGRVMVFEGQTRDSFQPNQPVFIIKKTKGEKAERYALVTKGGTFRPSGVLSALNPFGPHSRSFFKAVTVKILEALPSARIRHELGADPTGAGPPGIALKAVPGGEFFLRDGEGVTFGTNSSGVVKYVHLRKESELAELLKKSFAQRIEIVPPQGKPTAIPISVPQDVGKTFRSGPYTVTIEKYYPDFKVGREPSPDDEPRNPALKLTVSRESWKRSVYAFALFDFHGNRLPDGARVHYSRPRPGEMLLLVSRPDRSLKAYVSGKNEAAVLKPGSMARVSLGSRFAAITLKAFWPSSQVLRRAEADPSGQGPPAFKVCVEPGGSPTWIARGEGKALSSDGTFSVEVTDSFPLGFSITLKDAVALWWPGSSIPRAYYSDVVVTDPAGRSFPVRIETNAPVYHRGWRLYQSSMDQRSPYRWSGFQVASDPGEPVAAIGFYLLAAALLWLFTERFVVRPLRSSARKSITAGEAQQEEERA